MDLLATFSSMLALIKCILLIKQLCLSHCNYSIIGVASIVTLKNRYTFPNVEEKGSRVNGCNSRKCSASKVEAFANENMKPKIKKK